MIRYSLLLLLALPAAAKKGGYVEPAEGPRMIVDNMMERKRIMGVDKFCVRDIFIDGVKVFGGFKCSVKHGQKHALRLGPGKHRVMLDMISEFGENAEEPAVRHAFDLELKGDMLVLLRDMKEPEVSAFVEPKEEDIPPAPEGDPFAKLERLKQLYDKGVITADEFKEKKAQLLKQIR